MDTSILLFAAICALGPLATACVLLGRRRWHRRIVDLRLVLMAVAVLFVPATINLIVAQEQLRAQAISGWVSDQLLDIFQLPTTTSSSTTTTLP